MNLLYYISAIIIAVVFGIWLRQAAADELKVGRKWITSVFILGICGTVVFVVLGQAIASLTCAAAAIVAGISLQRRG